MILVIPSIDIRERKCARLVQEIPGSETRYSDDPVQMAILWRGENAKLLHVADLDGTHDNNLRNLDIITSIIRAVDIPIQVSGGIRTYEPAANLFKVGAARVVLSTKAVEDEGFIKRLITEFGPRKVVVAIDVNGDALNAISRGLKIKSLGVERTIYRDLSRDGTLAGPDADAIREFAEKTGLKVTVAGGIGGYPDLRRMQDLEPFGVDSVIIGRALYENRFPCQELWRRCEHELKDFAPTRRE